MHAPAASDPNGDMVIDDLPTGSFWIFAMNLFISCFFQFVGFLFTYLLHTSHAAKFGSRAGLGITLIQFGFYSRSIEFISPSEDNLAEVTSASEEATAAVADEPGMPVITSRDWLAFLFMTLGNPQKIHHFIIGLIHDMFNRMVPPPFVGDWLLACEALGDFYSLCSNAYYT